MKNLMVISILSIFCISGCSVIGLGIGIAAQEYDKFEPIYHIELLKEIDPGTKIIVKLKNDESIKGTLFYFEEFYRGSYLQDYSADSVYQKGYWELSMSIKGKDEIFNSNEVKMVEEIFEEGNYAVPIGLGIGIALDVIVYFWIKSLHIRF